MPSDINPYQYGAKITRSRVALDLARQRLERQRLERQEMMSSLMSLLRIGDTLISSSRDTEKLIGYAKRRGFEYKGSNFSKVFGGGKFMRDGQEFGREDILGLQYYEELEKTRSLYDSLFREGF